MGTKKLLAVLCAVVCLLGVEGQLFNEGKLVRNTRQRALSKRPVNPIISEDSYVIGSTKRPTYIEGGNQWKPLYNIPTRTLEPSQKYRSKPNIYSSKYSNNIHPSEYHPKSNPQQQQSTANFIANQSLLVADFTSPSNIKPSASYKKSKYQYVPKKNFNDNQQYEVHEEVDDAPSYSTQNQNQYRFHDIPVIKSVKSPIKPSIQYTEMIGPEKHIHHVHYHDTMEEALKASAAKQYVRNFRGNPASSRRPY